MKKYILNFVKYCAIFILVILIFTVLLALSSSFPSSWIKNNVKNSAQLLVQEGNRKYTYIIEKFNIMEFDNYSDALMINTAYSIDNSKPLYSSFVARKNYVPEIEQKIYEDSVGELHSASKYKKHDEVNELMDTVNKDITESFEYARYWHGYLVILRPILLIFGLRSIRIILTVLLICLSILVLYNIYKKLNIFYMFVFLFGLIGIEYFYMGLSIQGCFIFLITMFLMQLILNRYNKIKDISLYFFITGMITNFLDLLTNPLITLGMPLILYFLLVQKEKQLSIKESIIIFIKTCIPWAVGYGLTWLSKWVLADIIYNKGLIQTALSQILFRTQGTGKISSKLAIGYNLAYIEIPVEFMIIILTILFIYNTIKRTECLKFKQAILNIFPYLIICIMPYIWYFILKDHSYKHAFFTYRNQILMLLTIPIMYLKCFKLSRNK